MGPPDTENGRLLAAEVARLGREIAVLDRQWARKYRVGLLGLSALPIYAFVSPFWAGIVVLMTPALVATQAYLLMVRRAEARELLADAELQLRALRGATKA